MQPKRYIALFALVLTCLASLRTYSQLGFSFDVKKPPEYEERTLRSEKEQKKFTVPRRFVQNTTTHYNYFFNASNKINDIIRRAKEAHKDDYTALLPFYNYDLDVTARDTVQLDSVSYKAMSGIVLHDLRSDWADNMYLLWGAAYYLKKEFDSAYLTFQFINYAFAPKEKDGYYQYIGSSRDGNSALSISTKEKNSITRKIFTRPPSRNDAFIWQIRTFLAQDQFAEAASLIVTLKSDPVFPKRLHTDLEEVQALYFYKQNMWDSAAAHLVNSLGNTTNKQEQARWEYLAAQMYEMSGNYDLAKHYYEKSIGHTVDPVMEVYARLNAIRVDKTGGDNFIEKNIDALVRMAKRDKYSDYRDIIYYMAAQMELERNNIGGAQQWLLKAAKYDNGNITQRNKAYLKLADLAYANRDYRQAYNFYDSLKMNDPDLKDTATINQRKGTLEKIVAQLTIIDRQDSLQRIANMPEDERKDFVKKIYKALLKQQGIEDNSLTGGSGFNQPPTDLFSSSQSTKGEWYFYNTALRTKGASDFKAKWGNRPNVDNWRRLSNIAANIPRAKTDRGQALLKGLKNGQQEDELSFDALYSKLPLTEEAMRASNDSIAEAMFELGKVYAGEMDDCGSLINSFESLRTRFPDFKKMDEVLFRLYYCYGKSGDAVKANQVKSELASKHASSNFAKIALTGKDEHATGPNSDATKTYEGIYDLFIEGNFEEALSRKKAADSLYGDNYWSPQLLYIESVYYIKQREDSTAIKTLQKIQTKYSSSPLAAKATTMIDVLSRRSQIEEELRNLKVEPRQQPEMKKPDTTLIKAGAKPDSLVVQKTQQPQVNNNVVTNNQPKKDSTANKPVTPPPAAFSFSADAPYSVMIVLNKVDPVFTNEAKNAFARYNREKFYNKPFELNNVNLDADNKLLLIKPFVNAQAAIDYVNQVKRVAASEIVPWLKADKYSFSIISDQNLEILKTNPDLPAYKRFLDQNLPGKF